MDAKRWLNELRAELSRQKLPSLYVERMIGEMEDHIHQMKEDFVMESNGINRLSEQLGSPRQIASDSRRELDSSYFARRHPLLVFLVLPTLLMPVLTLLSIVAFTFTGSFLESFSSSQGFCVALWALSFVFPTTFLAFAGGRFARRAGLRWGWPLATCLVLAALASLPGVEIMPRPRPIGEDLIGDYFIVLNGPLSLPSLFQIVQTLVPLAVAIWLWRWWERESAALST